MRAGHMSCLTRQIAPGAPKSKTKNEFRIYFSLQATCIKMLKAIIAGTELEILFWEERMCLLPFVSRSYYLC